MSGHTKDKDPDAVPCFLLCLYCFWVNFYLDLANIFCKPSCINFFSLYSSTVYRLYTLLHKFSRFRHIGAGRLLILT
jgi:hypothetical protein